MSDELAARLAELERLLDAEVRARREGDAALASDVAEVRAMIASPEPDRRHNPIRWRRWMLQRVRRRHWAGKSDREAARLIRLAWIEVEDARRNAPYRPGTPEALIVELGAQGVRVLSERQIAEDLAS